MPRNTLSLPKKRKQRLRIGFVLDDGLDNPDGVQQYILTLGSWLTKKGHSVHYLVGQTSRTDIENIHSIPKNVKVRFNGNTMSIPLPASSRKIKRLLDELQLDVMHVQVPYSPFFGAKVIALSGTKTFVIGTFHIFPYGRVARIGTKLLGLVLSRNLRRFDAHLSVSTAAQSFAKQAFGIQSMVVPNIVDSEMFVPKKQAERPKAGLRLLFVGRLVDRKGCRLLLDALAEIHNTNPGLEFHLDICGHGPLYDSLQNSVFQNGLKRIVSFHGFVSEAQKISFMQNADVAIFPAYAGESFGIVLIEAMSAGSGVVLGGDNPGYRSVLADVPESLLNVSDQTAFAKRLLQILTDEQLRSDIHVRQQLLKKRFDDATVGEQILASYTDGTRSKQAKEELRFHE